MSPTLRDIYAWPSVVNLYPEAASVFGCSRSTAYDMAARGAFPVPVLKLGRLRKVSTAHLLAFLGAPLTPAHDEGPYASTAPALVALNTSQPAGDDQ